MGTQEIVRCIAKKESISYREENQVEILLKARPDAIPPVYGIEIVITCPKTKADLFVVGQHYTVTIDVNKEDLAEIEQTVAATEETKTEPPIAGKVLNPDADIANIAEI